MTKILTVAMQKGGVGKTTTAIHLAHGLAMMGRKVLLIDADPQASASDRFFQEDFQGTLADVLGVGGAGTKVLREVVVPTHQKHLYLIPADERLAESDKRIGDQGAGIGGFFALDLLLHKERLPFDYVVIDTPPGQSALLMAALVAADEVLMPVQLQPMGFEGFGKIVDSTIVLAREHQEIRGNVRLRLRAVVPTFYNRNRLASESLLSTLQNAEHPDYAGQPLPMTPPIVASEAFVRASAPIAFETEAGAQYRARTIWEMPSEGPGSTLERGQQAYEELTRYVVTYV